MALPVESVPNVLAELEEAFYDIPFENSDFQNRTFVVAAQVTPARAYRAIGLRMFAKIRAIKEALYGLQLSEIDIDENNHKASLPDTSDFERRRLAIKNAQIMESRKWTEKLLHDALRELDCLYTEFKKFPRYTREQFEQEEALHFEQMMVRKISGVEGAREALTNLQEDCAIMDRFLTEMAGDPAKLFESVNRLRLEASGQNAS